MNNIQRVEEWLKVNGQATEDAMAGSIEVPRHQLNHALRNASSRHRIHRVACISEGRARHAVWAYGPPAEKRPPPEVRGDFGIGRVNSVWQYAALTGEGMAA